MLRQDQSTRIRHACRTNMSLVLRIPVGLFLVSYGAMIILAFDEGSDTASCLDDSVPMHFVLEGT